MWNKEGCGGSQRGVEGGDEGTDATDVQRDQTFFSTGRWEWYWTLGVVIKTIFQTASAQWGEKKRVNFIERNLFPLSEYVSEQAGE